MHIPTIDTVIFDLGGVLVDWNPRYLYRKIFKDEAEMEWFLSQVCTPEWNAMQDAGRTIAEASGILLEAYPQYREQILAFYDRFEETFSGVIPGTAAILRQLAASGSYRLYALTNWSAETMPRAKKIFEEFHLFEGMVVSGEEKLVKPDPAIYQLLFERFGIQPPRSVYIDDSLPNVQAASQLGLHAIHFNGPEQLRAELEALLPMQFASAS
ncbi:MAG: HAD family phosphatase [Bacteroidetes bacterium]|nr:MAG: HAD family phosphatase [Bacteroidota bacterium]